MAMPWPAERVSSGWISEGYSHPRGPPAHREADCSVAALSLVSAHVCVTAMANKHGKQSTCCRCRQLVCC